MPTEDSASGEDSAFSVQSPQPALTLEARPAEWGGAVTAAEEQGRLLQSCRPGRCRAPQAACRAACLKGRDQRATSDSSTASPLDKGTRG